MSGRRCGAGSVRLGLYRFETRAVTPLGELHTELQMPTLLGAWPGSSTWTEMNSRSEFEEWAAKPGSRKFRWPLIIDRLPPGACETSLRRFRTVRRGGDLPALLAMHHHRGHSRQHHPVRHKHHNERHIRPHIAAGKRHQPANDPTTAIAH